MRKYRNRVEETTQNKNRTQFKFKSINPVHQTNANKIITVTTNDVQCESSLKCIRESSIESLNCLKLQIRVDNCNIPIFS